MVQTIEDRQYKSFRDNEDGTWSRLVHEYGDVGLNRDAWGVKKVSSVKSLFHGMFTFDVPQTKWFMYHNDTQVYTSTNIVSTNGAGTFTTDATNHTLRVESRLAPRYQPNRGHLFSTAVICPNKTNDGVREWGLGTDQNGICFKLKADGLLYACLKSGGSITKEEVIDTSDIPNFDVEKGNVYDIQFQWRGVGNYYFYINLTKVKTFANLGTLTALSLENPALPVRYEAKRTTENVSIVVGCADISSENGDDEHLEYGSAYATNVAVTTVTPVLVIKQPLAIGSYTNTRDLTLARLSFNCSKKAVFRVWVTRDATAFTGGTFLSVNNGSYVETDSPDTKTGAVRVTAVDTTKLRFITAVPVEAAVPREVDNPWPHEINFQLVRGDYLVVTCTAATATADVVAEWGEHI